jgi:RNA polymerase sigma-70 factor, ECF subfamily
MTRLLQEWHDGDSRALDRLMPMVVEELRRIATGHFAREAPGHTLQPTALVNEVYLRLIDAGRVDWQSRDQFFRIAARLMRRVLVDHARGRQAAKRWGEARRTAVDVDRITPDGRAVDLAALDDALSEMARINPEGCEIVEMRYFAGLTLEEIAELLGVSRTTVKRRWHTAKLWLVRELGRGGGSGGSPAAGGDGR